MRGAVIAVVNYDTSSPTGRSMRIVGHDASFGTAADKQPVTLSVDDGSVPNLLFTVSEKLVAWDMTTRDIAWSSNVAVDTTAVPLGGRLFTRRSDGKLLTLDAATGATLWDQPVADLKADGTLLTDGRWMLAAQVGTGIGLTLVAYALSDGHRTWETPRPKSIGFVWVFNHQLVGIAADSSTSTVLG
ncbi:MAG: PQQ-binding-like beta-propeller repeat protein [Cellulomonas sp.]|uniref:outer membrane protein assembly factor BamB family protein n=1 Tax=Cellulomonas sp. TaxID=40001 RepID=UPI0017977EC7|nr:PQQ-binding-like beta-propeller repeat protein [Cellulomonas sp.]NMM31423.1 PQQ-binding-like beta-propeller repeat protein [Cellulomonas sp.]